MSAPDDPLLLWQQAVANLEEVQREMADLVAFTIETEGRRNRFENAKLQTMWEVAEDNLATATAIVQEAAAAVEGEEPPL